MTTKHITLLREIIFPTLPEFKSPIVQEAFLKLIEKYPKVIDVENLIEYSLSNQGGYEFIDSDGQDFNDVNDSDSKTVTVNINSHKAEIVGLENKIGSIRITLYNSLSDENVSFFYIPTHYVPFMSRECYGINEGKKRMIITWSEKRPKKYASPRIGYFNQYEKFRLDSFQELAKMTDENFYLKNPSMRPSTTVPVVCLIPSTKNHPSLQTPIPYMTGHDLQ